MNWCKIPIGHRTTVSKEGKKWVSKLANVSVEVKEA